MPQRKGLLAPQNTFLDTIATRFDGTHSNFVLGNAQAKDHPIVYCSDGFCELTGFARVQVMSRSCACRFLWGIETEEDKKGKIETALLERSELKMEVYFTKKTGTSFLCLLDIVPIKNEKGEVVLFLASHKNISRVKSVGFDVLSNDDKNDVDNNCNDIDEEDTDCEENSTCYKHERRRSRAVLYHLSGQFQPKSKTNKICQFNKIQNLSGKNNFPEYKVEQLQKSRFILVHYGLFKIFWDWCILLCTFYIAIVVPYNAAFPEVSDSVYSRKDRKDGKDLLLCDLMIEVLFIIDIVLNYRTTFVSKSGQVVFNPRTIAINYIRGWFLLDLLAAIPFDFVILFQKLNERSNFNGTFGPQMHLMKLARLLRLARLLQKIDRYSQYSVVVLGLLMSMFGLCAHWLACIWHAIGQDELKYTVVNNQSVIFKQGWLFELSDKIDAPYRVENGTISGGPSTEERYLAALYFTCSSLTSVGFGNVSANTKNEKIFSVCAMLIGALMHAAVFGNVSAIIQRMYVKRYAFQTKSRDLKEFTRIHHIPKDLKQRMQEFFQTMWSINRGINPDDLMKDFPEELRGDIMLHLNREVLSLPIFEKAGQGCLKALAQQIKITFCTPGEYLVHRGDVLKYIYFVCSGSMEIRKDDMVVAILGKGDLFGTEMVSRSTCDVKSLTYCDIQCIDLSGLLHVLLQYPEYHVKFNEDLLHDLTYNMREGAEDECFSDEEHHNMQLPSIFEEENEDYLEDEEENEEQRKEKTKDNEDEEEDDDDGKDGKDGNDGTNVELQKSCTYDSCESMDKYRNKSNSPPTSNKDTISSKSLDFNERILSDQNNFSLYASSCQPMPMLPPSSIHNQEFESSSSSATGAGDLSKATLSRAATVMKKTVASHRHHREKCQRKTRHEQSHVKTTVDSACHLPLINHSFRRNDPMVENLETHAEISQVRTRVMQIEEHMHDLRTLLRSINMQLSAALPNHITTLSCSNCGSCSGDVSTPSPMQQQQHFGGGGGFYFGGSDCSDKTEIMITPASARHSPTNLQLPPEFNLNKMMLGPSKNLQANPSLLSVHRLSPRSASSGFVSNQEDLSPRVYSSSSHMEAPNFETSPLYQPFNTSHHLLDNYNRQHQEDVDLSSNMVAAPLAQIDTSSSISSSSTSLDKYLKFPNMLSTFTELPNQKIDDISPLCFRDNQL